MSNVDDDKNPEFEPLSFSDEEGNLEPEPLEPLADLPDDGDMLGFEGEVPAEEFMAEPEGALPAEEFVPDGGDGLAAEVEPLEDAGLVEGVEPAEEALPIDEAFEAEGDETPEFAAMDDMAAGASGLAFAEAGEATEMGDEAETEVAAKGKKTKKKRKKKEGPGLLASITQSDPYTVMLGVALLAIVIAVYCLMMELKTYDFQIKAEAVQRPAVTTPYAQFGPAITAVAACPTEVQFNSNARDAFVEVGSRRTI